MLRVQKDLFTRFSEITGAWRKGVVDAVKGDRAEEGPNGELYGAVGYVRKSQRATGLVRARKGAAATEGGSASWRRC